MSAATYARVFRYVALLFLLAGVGFGIAPKDGVAFRILPETWFLWAVALVAYLVARSPRPIDSRPPTNGALSRVNRAAYDR